MKTVTKDTREAPVKWWAAQDARMRNIANKSHWAPSVQLQVERMKMVLGLLYMGRVYEAYGKRQVSIKIDGARVRDPRELAAMEAEWSSKGIVKTLTPQGLLYKVA